MRQSPGAPETEQAGTTRLIHQAKWLRRRPSRIIYNAKTAATEHEELGYPQHCRVVIPNGFDTDRFRPDPCARNRIREELGLSPATRLVGMIARYHPVKDHAGFLRAAALLAARAPDVHFLLTGAGVTGDNRELGDLARSLNLEPCCHFLGERHDVPAVTAALDVATLTSLSEGFPNVVGEAMACGVPVAATAAGEAPELLDRIGAVVPCGDPERMAASWQLLLELPEDRRRTIGAEGRDRILDRYSIDPHGVGLRNPVPVSGIGRVDGNRCAASPERWNGTPLPTCGRSSWPPWAARSSQRGPDDEGAWFDAETGIGLAHRRLAVIDVSPEGRQPMASRSGRFVIAYNGEIYNYEALRNDLAGENIPWRGHSDTEVLLEAVEAWSVPEAVRRAVGMFAFALWDRQETGPAPGPGPAGDQAAVLRLVRPVLPVRLRTEGAQGPPPVQQPDRPQFGSRVPAAQLHSLLHGRFTRTIYKQRPGTILTFDGNRFEHRDDCRETVYWSMETVAEQGIADPYTEVRR